MTQLMDQPATRGNGAANADNLPTIHQPRLPYHPAVEERFGVDKASWKALVEAIFPNASSTESVILALSYCRARKLDPFKRNVHIVPIYDKNRKCMVDTIWPGIGELRTTAFRTGEYAGRDKTEFGPNITKKVGNANITFPEWAMATVYRIVRGQRVAFAGPQVYWLETYATVRRDDDTPNEMWSTRTRGQLEKCAEAAALRAAFPEEVGTDYIPEEIARDGAQPRQIVSTPVGESRTESLLKKITSRPVDEGQTFEPAQEAIDEVTHDIETAPLAAVPDAPTQPAPTPAAQAPQAGPGVQRPPDSAPLPPVADGETAAGPVVEVAMSDEEKAQAEFNEWLEACDAAAQESLVPRAQVEKELRGLLAAKGLTATPWKLAGDVRQRTLNDIRGRTGLFAPAKARRAAGL